jgi:hypothetical protein
MFPRVAAASIVLLAMYGDAQHAVAAQRAPASGTPRPDAIVPFTISVPDAVPADLKQRLTRTRFPREIDGSGWDDGTNLAYLKELVTYWRDPFDWRAAEARLNRFDQFTTTAGHHRLRCLFCILSFDLWVVIYTRKRRQPLRFAFLVCVVLVVTAAAGDSGTSAADVRSLVQRDIVTIVRLADSGALESICT